MLSLAMELWLAQDQARAAFFYWSDYNDETGERGEPAT